jgi:hypothetical protein
MTNNSQDRKAPRTVTPWRLSTEKLKREQMPTHNDEYDPSEFLFPNYDSDGRSAMIRVRMPASLNYAIDIHGFTSASGNVVCQVSQPLFWFRHSGSIFAQKAFAFTFGT